MKLNIFLLSFYLLVNPQTVTSISQSSEKGELLPFSLHSPANSEKMSEHINSKYLGDQIHEDGTTASIHETRNNRIPIGVETETIY